MIVKESRHELCHRSDIPTLSHTLHRPAGAYTVVVIYNQIHLFNTVLLDSKQLGLTKFMNASLYMHTYIYNNFLNETIWQMLLWYFMKLKLFCPKLNNNTTLISYNLRWTC